MSTSSGPSRRMVPLLLPPPSNAFGMQLAPAPPVASSRRGAEWASPGDGPLRPDVVREQRDGLVRQRGRLASAVRALRAENESLRRQLALYRADGRVDQRRKDETADARRLEREVGITFHHMPDGVYPGRPYITQQDLIRQGATRYSRQNMSRLARSGRSLPVVLIADRMLLPPEAVRTLLEREKAAARDPSPRRRPGGSRVERGRGA